MTERDKAIETLSKCFLCAIPLADLNRIVNLEEVSSLVTWEEQESLLKLTVDRDLVGKFPIKISYQRCFLKYFIDQWEKRKIDVCDGAYDALGRLMSQPADGDTIFKHFEFENGRIITLKEKDSFISEGTTGLCVWKVKYCKVKVKYS